MSALAPGPAPPLFFVYEWYSAFYGRSAHPCTNCRDVTTCHAKLRHIKENLYSIGQCEGCRWEMGARVQSRLTCSFRQLVVRLRDDGTAVRVNGAGNEVNPDGSQVIRGRVDLPAVMDEKWTDSFAWLLKIKSTGKEKAEQGNNSPSRSVVAKLFKASLAFAFKSSKPKPKPKHGPNDKIAPILVRCRSLTRSMSKTMAVGTTLGEKLESKNMSVRWK